MGHQIVLNPIEITASINDTYFDLRDYGAVSSIKDQKSKGICWAFSLCEILESAYYLATGQHIDVSPNNLGNFPYKYSP